MLVTPQYPPIPQNQYMSYFGLCEDGELTELGDLLCVLTLHVLDFHAAHVFTVLVQEYIP